MRRSLLVPPVIIGLLAVIAPSAHAHPGGDPPGLFQPPGVVITPTGQVTAVREFHNNGWIVLTPCNGEAFVSVGTFVRQVDVVLDPGHGGSESGSVGSNRLAEKTLNLAVALRAERILEQEYGLSVQLTRTQDVRVPLRTRGAIAEALRPRAFVSIHHNGGATAKRGTPGTEVFHQVSSSESRRLGGILYEEIFRAMDQYNIQFAYSSHAGTISRIRNDGIDLYGVLRNAPNVPSVITEALYLSNPDEATLLAREDVQETEARALAVGIVRFLTTTDPGSGFKPPYVDETTTGTGGVEGCREPDLGQPEIQVATGYTPDEAATIVWAADQLGLSPEQFQKAGVAAIDFIRGLTGFGAVTPPATVPDIHGPILVGTTWTTSDQSSLERTVHAYGLGPQEVQKIGVYFLAYLTGLRR